MDVFVRSAENELLKLRRMAARWVRANLQGVMGRAIPKLERSGTFLFEFLF